MDAAGKEFNNSYLVQRKFGLRHISCKEYCCLPRCRECRVAKLLRLVEEWHEVEEELGQES